MLSWMVWTTPVTVFFSCVGLMLVGMTIWEFRSPTVMRKGFLPIPTTRGDRLFISLLAAGYINLIVLGMGGTAQGLVQPERGTERLGRAWAVGDRAGFVS